MNNYIKLYDNDGNDFNYYFDDSNDYELLPDAITDEWLSIYSLAKNYYEHHGNLLVPQNFKTKNGYNYDESGYNLGTWIIHQRVNYKNFSLSERSKELREEKECISQRSKYH